MYSCTDAEAGRLGRFLAESISQLAHWRSEASVYERDCAALPGFNTQARTRGGPGREGRGEWGWVMGEIF